MQNTYVRSSRKRWALSQDELAELLGISQSVVSRYETGDMPPDPHTLFGLQVIFGTSPRALFPTLYRMVEEKVMARAVRLDRHIGQRQDSAAQLKRRLLTSMVFRANKTRPAL